MEKAIKERLLYKSPKLKLIIGVPITIFLGAIGSGLWQILLAPLFAKFSDFTMTFISNIFYGYTDFIYQNVSNNPSIQLTHFLYSGLLVFTLAFLLFIVLYPLYKITKEINDAINNQDDKDMTRDEFVSEMRKTRKMFYILLPISLILTGAFIAKSFQTEHAIKAAMFIERSIEIVSPFISETERLTLRAKYRGIDNAADFYKLEISLREIAKKHSCVLPEFKAIH